MRGIDRLVAKETGLPVHVAEDPMSAVAEGTGQVLSAKHGISLAFDFREELTSAVRPSQMAAPFGEGGRQKTARLAGAGSPMGEMLKKSHYITLVLVVLLVVVLLSLPTQTVDRFKLAVSGLFLPLFGLAASSREATTKAGDALPLQAGFAPGNQRTWRIEPGAQPPASTNRRGLAREWPVEPDVEHGAPAAVEVADGAGDRPRADHLVAERLD